MRAMQWVPQKPPSRRARWLVYAVVIIPIVVAVLFVIGVLIAIEANPCCY